METFKAYLLIVGFVGALGFGGYWAATSLKEPVRIAEMEEIQVTAQTPIETITDTTATLPEEVPVVEEIENNIQESNVTPEVSEGTHSDLIAKLQKLVTDNVLMKEGSRGTRVGTVQEFLNVYNKTSGGIDNDYGPGTQAKIRAFQKAHGLTADGQAGPNTYKKMIDWLNKQ